MSQQYANPFENIEIQDHSLPTSPSTGFVQTQNSQDAASAMTQPNIPITGSEMNQVMNAFSNMVTGQPQQQAQQPVFQQPQQQAASEPIFQQPTPPVPPQQPVFQQPQQQIPQPQQQIPHPQPQQQYQSSIQGNIVATPQYQQTTQPLTFKQPNNNQAKYFWSELFWFINPKIKTNTGLGNEVPLLIVAFNADYGNLNIRFCNIKNITQSSLSTQDIERLPAHMNLYAEHAAEILQSPVGSKINIIERVFKTDTTWKPGISVVSKENNSIVLSTVLNNSQYNYTLINDQYWAFYKGLEFMINGVSWTLTLLDRLILNK